jgi:hypothetical protein
MEALDAVQEGRAIESGRESALRKRARSCKNGRRDASMIEWISSGMCTYLISGSALIHQVLLGAEL